MIAFRGDAAVQHLFRISSHESGGITRPARNPATMVTEAAWRSASMPLFHTRVAISTLVLLVSDRVAFLLA
ncbi:hypothetical protein [Noviherbaspirillum pedocola]|uniref:Uncharacterized protein n=1 Tax=Noviherbaspirillum pedocola TaxID=2801341 RepID=A0A934SYB9_9BURK|nr:hypothetical protein [Noviherbaspirillum pedocola]MBK4737992.1 hypothetical protein [Noviherbaspirillum pedocola]